MLKSFQSFVRPKTIAGRVPKKERLIKRKLLYLALLLQEAVTPMSHFSAPLDNVIILMKGIHRNIMKNDMIVQWKIKLFETRWFQSTAQCFSCLAVCWSQQGSFASRYSHYLQTLVEWVLVSWLPGYIFRWNIPGSVCAWGKCHRTVFDCTSNQGQSSFREGTDTPVLTVQLLFPVPWEFSAKSDSL